MTNMNKRSMLAMILAVFIGLVCALVMCVQRNEKWSNVCW